MLPRVTYVIFHGYYFLQRKCKGMGSVDTILIFHIFLTGYYASPPQTQTSPSLSLPRLLTQCRCPPATMRITIIAALIAGAAAFGTFHFDVGWVSMSPGQLQGPGDALMGGEGRWPSSERGLHRQGLRLKQLPPHMLANGNLRNRTGVLSLHFLFSSQSSHISCAKIFVLPSKK